MSYLQLICYIRSQGIFCVMHSVITNVVLKINLSILRSGRVKEFAAAKCDFFGQISAARNNKVKFCKICVDCLIYWLQIDSS